VILMQCAALTGIAEDVISDMRHGRPRTLELQSTHNVVTLAETKPGNLIFMTSVDREDLSPGDRGILVYILTISLTMKRVIEFSNGHLYEERERLSARIQIKFCSNSTIKAVEKVKNIEPAVVDVVKAACYHAG